MTASLERIFELLPDFARLERRAVATAALAEALGVEEVMLLSRDPELDVLLPAPGLPQTLPDARVWRAFLERCSGPGTYTGELPAPDGSPRPARVVVADPGAVAVLVGAWRGEPEEERLTPLLAILGALFRSEVRTAAAEARVAVARESVDRARTLATTLQEVRGRLEKALRDAEAARFEARDRALQAETLTEELRLQAVHLEEQASELAALNRELARRTEDADRARAQADAANRAKSDFLTTMSHEMRTPIHAIMGNAGILEMGVSGEMSSRQRTQLDRIRSSSRHLLALLDDVLDLAKVEAGYLSVERRLHPVDDVIADALELLEAQAAQRGVRVEDECGSARITYVGDEDRVRQILTNLLSNAVKFTERGGRVSVRCGVTEAPDPEARLSGSGLWTWLAVDDTGTGIQADQLERVFEPFVQVEGGQDGRGTGLGLPISRQLARLMAGDVTASSEPGEGSRFTLWLPTTFQAGDAPAG